MYFSYVFADMLFSLPQMLNAVIFLETGLFCKVLNNLTRQNVLLKTTKIGMFAQTMNEYWKILYAKISDNNFKNIYKTMTQLLLSAVPADHPGRVKDFIWY